jgi:hydrogenase maturation factor HypF (carbamoyltransferase family)
VGLELAEIHDISTIGLNGGVRQNRLLLEATFQRMRGSGFKVLAPFIVPANDGGVGLGAGCGGTLSREYLLSLFLRGKGEP